MICTDKTGTLTKAEMTVKEIWSPASDVDVTGAGYEPVGRVRRRRHDADSTDEARRRLEPLLRAMTFANDAKMLAPPTTQGWRVIGDPTEGCLLVAARKAGFDLEEELVGDRRSTSCRSSRCASACRSCTWSGDGQKAYVKGAPSETIARCTHMRIDGHVVPLTAELRERVVAENDAMSRRALRVLAVCRARAALRASPTTHPTASRPT